MDETLQEEHDFLLRSLADLDRELAAGDIDAADYDDLRQAYAARADQVGRALAGDSRAGDSRAGDSRAGAPLGVRALPRRAGSRPWVFGTALTVVAVLGFGVVAGALVAASSGERVRGGQISGSVGRGASQRLERARQLMGEGKALPAIKMYDAVLKDEPDNAEALAYRGWLLQLAGLPDQALASLDRAVAADPAFPDAHFFRGIVLYRGKHDPAAAIPELRAFMASRPDPQVAPMVEKVLDQALEEAGQKP